MVEGNSVIYDDINDIIEELTTTASKDLDEEYMKQLKQHCKSSNDNLKVAYHILMNQLEKQHAEIRYSTFQIIDQLFNRSHLFRTLIISKLQNIFSLTVETDPIHYQSPLPKKVAKSLKLFALKTFNEWNKVYGKHYRKLELGFEFLQNVQKVRFNDINHLTLEQRQKEKLIKEKEKRINKSKLEQVDMQLNDSYDDIVSNIKQIDNCFQLLIPKISDSSELSTGDSNASSTSTNKQSDKIPISDMSNNSKEMGNHTKESENENDETISSECGDETGIHRNDTVSIELPSKHFIRESSDNADIIERMKELFKELQQQVVRVKRWLNILLKCDSKEKEKIEKLLQLKNTISSLIEKYLELNILKMKNESESENDEEFIDVPENITYKFEDSFTGQVADQQQPGPSSASSSSQTRKEKLLQVAPVVSFDTDLQYWGTDKLPTSYKADSLHRFWKPAEHEETFVPPQMVAAMKTRRMHFIGKDEPIQRACGALLSNGNFCERMDRLKCPFHGEIIERDGFGRPVDSRDAEIELKRKHKRERDERELIQKEIDATLGTNLSSKKRKKIERPIEKSKRRYARLTNIKSDFQKGGLTKLEKKIFNKRALSKIYDSENASTRKIQNEKFGSHFNY